MKQLLNIKNVNLSIINYNEKILSSFTFVDKVLILPKLKDFNDYARLVQNICPAVIAVTKHDPQLINKFKQN
ncbi:hypothetical protein [Rickettsia honei]|uniref:hypothetical protein n=1 Tax=Rickettsia honei TaxID=37816 RepID=UPI0002E2DB0F|nr:hypothetical protein [Rickettsia honei]